MATASAYRNRVVKTLSSLLLLLSRRMQQESFSVVAGLFFLDIAVVIGIVVYVLAA